MEDGRKEAALTFTPTHERVSHTIRLPLEPERCFPLFTPGGEREWVPDWDPTFLHDGPSAVGTVFLTGHGGEETIWTVVDMDAAAGRARYSRVTPGSRAVLVEVLCRPVDPGGTEVTVTYHLTALTASGVDYIGGFVGPAFAEMIEAWRTLILKSVVP